MSQRHPREEKRGSSSKHLPVASKCLAIVLLPKKKHGKSPQDGDNNNKVEEARKCNNSSGGGGGDTVNTGNNTAITNATKGVCSASTIASNTTTSHHHHHQPVYSGKDILDDFKQQNKTCYWNPALIESIKKLEYLGFVEPCTVLVSGEDIHLENLRSAWGRRVLKPPNNFSIDRIGDVNGIEMQVIPQTQFIPLPDSLCLIITEINKEAAAAAAVAAAAGGGSTSSHLHLPPPQPATLEAIRSRLQLRHANTALPSAQLLYDTLGQLIRERKVYHNGTGYCVVTPETFPPMPGTGDPSLTCAASWLPYHPMYIPVFPQQQQQHPPFKAPTRSISCQVTHIEEKQSSEGSQRAEKKRSRPRSHSVRACRGKDKAAQAEKENAADFRRAASARYKADKVKAANKELKNANVNHQDKEKGEKVSLFSKIFGRKKKSSSAGTGTGTVSTSSGGGTQSTETEYATFSGQFPPPEWLWYQQQLERQRRTEEWVSQQLPKSATWGQLHSLGAVVPSSGVAEPGSVETARTESSHPYAHHHHHPSHATQAQLASMQMSSQGHVYATLGHLQGPSLEAMRGGGGVGQVAGGGGEEEQQQQQRKMKQQYRMSGSHHHHHARKGHHHHHHHHHHHQRDRGGGGGGGGVVGGGGGGVEHNHKYRDYRKTLQENNYDVPVSQHYGGVDRNFPPGGMEVTPYSLEGDNIYSTPGPSQTGQMAPWHSTPCYDIPPAKMESLAMASHIAGTSTIHQEEPSDVGGKAQSSHHHHHQQPPSHMQRRTHRSKRHAHRAYNLFEASNAGTDISVEYQGRMPKKNSSVAQSRDSGVNCIGLPQNRQHYMEEADLHMTQEASAYLPSRHHHHHHPHPPPHHPSLADTATTTTSSLHPNTVSTQRGTPYTSMEQRNPEGCSQHEPIINNVIINPPPVSSSGGADMNSAGMTPSSDNQSLHDSGGSGADGGATVSTNRPSSLSQDQQDPSGGRPSLEERSECEGVSHTSTPHYVAVGSPDMGGDSVTLSPHQPEDPNTTPQFLAMSYCDSSLGEEGAGGGEVLLCQAEINQFQVPQLVLDTESRLDRGNISSEPDIALSSAGSKDTLDRTNEDSERSVETVVRSPQFAAAQAQGGAADGCDGRTTGSAGDRPAAQAEGAGSCAVTALGHRFQEVGVVDSGFSSPRNNEGKENQQQQQQPVSGDKSVPTQPTCHPHHKHSGSGEGGEEMPPPVHEHKSKHERIKAFVKQTNQLLEQRQFAGHEHAPYTAPGVAGVTVHHHTGAEHDAYVNYPFHNNPHTHHYAPFPSKPMHPSAQQQQQQQQQQQMANSQQRPHHHHPARPLSLHMKGGSKSQTVWPASGQTPAAMGKMLPSELKAFEEQQLKGKKFGLNGEEFEVVGVV